MGFRDFLDRLFEPSFDNVKFVTHYQPPLEYKIATKVNYDFIVREETYLPTQIVSNTYTQNILVTHKFKSGNSYEFDLTTTNQKFILDKSLASQRPILEDLSLLTKEICLVVDSSGTIIGFNHKELLKQWKPLKEKLLRRYKGKLSNAYINSIDKRIKQKNLFLEELQQAKLFGLLFNGYQQAHQMDQPRQQKETMVVHCLSAYFDEKTQHVLETDDTKSIEYSGVFKPYDAITQSRIREYLSYYGITISDVYLTNYIKKVALDMTTGLPKHVLYNLELTNGGGYVRKKQYELKQQGNG